VAGVKYRDDLDDLDEVLRRGAVRAVYQPIVDLASGAPVGYEALARGPVGTSLERPDALFAAARAAGRLGQLDWACRAAALRGAFDAGMVRSLSLFVNIEPEVADVEAPPEVHGLLVRAERSLGVIVEVTERALVASPAALLAMVARTRARGWGVAIDDVGADVASLALMPFLQPDVIKLDLRLVQAQPDAEIATIVAAVNAQTERTGASVLAEGIETPAHADMARAFGATLGQGWALGRPGPLPRGGGREAPRVVPRSTPAPVPRSTVAAAGQGRQLRRSTKPLLIEMSLLLERQAEALGQSSVVLSAFQTADRFTPATIERYTRLARSASFVGALAVGLTDAPAPGVRGGHLEADDPLVDEWAVAIVGPHFAAALAAVDLHDDGPDSQRRFDYILTYDRDRVLAVAASLMARIAAVPVAP
jgi:EAL domain-containing protein (putative c-di-GMP-specific phosphodiesterase class I)